MKKNYDKSIRLRCVVCGSDSDFECSEDKVYIKCNKCNREYKGGYNELVELNKALIDDEIEKTTEEITFDVQTEIETMLKDAFKGNKYFKVK
jgi:ribosomal protein L37AE/L43A